jgi:hypothetical protein
MAKRRKPLALKIRQKISRALQGKKKKNQKGRAAKLIVGGAVGGAIGGIAAQRIISKKRAIEANPTTVTTSKESTPGGASLDPGKSWKEEPVSYDNSKLKKRDKRTKKAWGFKKNRAQVEEAINTIARKKK